MTVPSILHEIRIQKNHEGIFLTVGLKKLNLVGQKLDPNLVFN